MLASITPLGQRGRGASWTRTVTSYVVACAAGGAVMGTTLGALGSVLPGVDTTVTVLVVAALAVLAAASDLRGRPPSLHRQVDESWLTRYRDWVCGVGFGFQLGLGAVTIATSASLYLTWLLEVLAGSPAAGALIGLVFGVGRALPILTNRHVLDPESLRRSQRRWQRFLAVVRPATIAVETAAAVALVVAVAG
jgi:sulfite exporter TauE/SafE